MIQSVSPLFATTSRIEFSVISSLEYRITFAACFLCNMRLFGFCGALVNLNTSSQNRKQTAKQQQGHDAQRGAYNAKTAGLASFLSVCPHSVIQKVACGNETFNSLVFCHKITPLIR